MTQYTVIQLVQKNKAQLLVTHVLDKGRVKDNFLHVGIGGSTGSKAKGKVQQQPGKEGGALHLGGPDGRQTAQQGPIVVVLLCHSFTPLSAFAPTGSADRGGIGQHGVQAVVAFQVFGKHGGKVAQVGIAVDVIIGVVHLVLGQHL